MCKADVYRFRYIQFPSLYRFVCKRTTFSRSLENIPFKPGSVQLKFRPRHVSNISNLRFLKHTQIFYYKYITNIFFYFCKYSNQIKYPMKVSGRCFKINCVIHPTLFNTNKYLYLFKNNKFAIHCRDSRPSRFCSSSTFPCSSVSSASVAFAVHRRHTKRMRFRSSRCWPIVGVKFGSSRQTADKRRHSTKAKTAKRSPIAKQPKCS